jgi:hypothetical protein
LIEAARKRDSTHLAFVLPVVTTQRYMHLSPGGTEAAIALLEAPRRGGWEPVTTWARRLERLETTSDHSPSMA